MVQIALIANSKILNDQLIKRKILQHDKVIAVDGGLNHCNRMRIVPDLIIGDLDSINQELLPQYLEVPTKTFPIDKDHSDLELALIDCLGDQVEKVSLFGVLENRLDHSLANLYLLSNHADKSVIESDYETVYCVRGFQEFTCYPGQQISLIPFPCPCVGVSTTGLKWEITDKPLNQSFYSLSNVTLGTSFTVDVKQGTLICCLLRS